MEFSIDGLLNSASFRLMDDCERTERKQRIRVSQLNNLITYFYHSVNIWGFAFFFLRNEMNKGDGKDVGKEMGRYFL